MGIIRRYHQMMATSMLDESPSNFPSIMSKKCTVCDISEDLILGVIIMSGRRDNEIAKNPLPFLCQFMGFQEREVRQKWAAGPQRGRSLIGCVFEDTALRQESREWVVEVTYEYGIGARK